MLRRLLLAAVALAVTTTTAAAAVPVRPGDAPLLARRATAQEQLAQSIARRLTGHAAVARCSVVDEGPGVWGSGRSWTTGRSATSCSCRRPARRSRPSAPIRRRSIRAAASPRARRASLTRCSRSRPCRTSRTTCSGSRTKRRYWSAECRDGGKLDLRPESHAWPS